MDVKSICDPETGAESTDIVKRRMLKWSRECQIHLHHEKWLVVKRCRHHRGETFGEERERRMQRKETREV